MVLKNPYKLTTQNSLVNVSSACAKNLYCYWMQLLDVLFFFFFFANLRILIFFHLFLLVGG